MKTNKFQGLPRGKRTSSSITAKKTPRSYETHPDNFKSRNVGMTRRKDMMAKA